VARLLAGVMRFRLLILGVAVEVPAIGIAQLRGAPVDALPEFSPPYAEVQTEALGLSAGEVVQQIFTPGTGGFVETPQQRRQVRQVLEKVADPAELAKVPLEGSNLRLGNVADIKVDHQRLIGDAVVV
jgi:Cu/Ag efflux pump CusA